MCGIFFSIARTDGEDAFVEHSKQLQILLDRRGPDSGNGASEVVETAISSSALNWYCTVLSLRGEAVTPQPLIDEKSGSKFCWNGEAWNIAGEAVSGNDAQAIFELLMHAVLEAGSEFETTGQSVVDVLMSIRGPFAFVFYDAVHARVYFARDALGRRSLLMKQELGALTFVSVSDGTHGWKEVPADGIYAIDLAHVSSTSLQHGHDVSNNTRLIKVLNLHNICYRYEDYGKYSAFDHTVPSAAPAAQDEHSAVVAKLETLLRSAIDVRTRSIPYRIRRPSQQGLNGRNGLARPTSAIRPAGNPRLAVLFSGGLDCTVLARIIHDAIPAGEQIDLLNVAFHNPRSHGAEITNDTDVYELCPDRITARASYAELTKVCPDRPWQLVCINVPYAETLEHRRQVLSLMFPHETEMDMSIALALYFAARGTGVVGQGDDDSPYTYTTPARVLFSGLGADELFGGYQRHSTAYLRQGFVGLLAELELDINRLGQRNLGRDDRVISHWGKEARYPFLDEELVRWAVTAPVWEKCGFGQAQTITGAGNLASPSDIEPGKKVLRLLAHKLGMVNVAHEKKRAIQFGARTAKMGTVGGKIRGTQKVA